MAETLTEATHNGTSATSKVLKRGFKRPNNRFVGASTADLAETRLTLGIETTPTSWDNLPINATFSKSKNGLPLCVKVSVSAFVEVFSNRRESRIGGGEVFRVVQK
jgi:hypothetical protein